MQCFCPAWFLGFPGFSWVFCLFLLFLSGFLGVPGFSACFCCFCLVSWVFPFSACFCCFSLVSWVFLGFHDVYRHTKSLGKDNMHTIERAAPTNKQVFGWGPNVAWKIAFLERNPYLEKRNDTRKQATFAQNGWCGTSKKKKKKPCKNSDCYDLAHSLRLNQHASIAGARIADQTAARVRIAGISHRSILKNMPNFRIAGQHRRISDGAFVALFLWFQIKLGGFRIASEKMHR